MSVEEVIEAILEKKQNKKSKNWSWSADDYLKAKNMKQDHTALHRQTCAPPALSHGTEA